MGKLKVRAREAGSGRFLAEPAVGTDSVVERVQGSRGRRRKDVGSAPRDLKVLEVSVTISVGGADVDVLLLPALQKFLSEATLASKCSLERGGTVFHLHYQMVVRMVARSVIAVSKAVKRYIGWDVLPPPGGVVLCPALWNKGLHTFIGMLGYCMKDMEAPHYQSVDHNLSAAADLAAGLEMYAQYGAEDKNNRVSLTWKNTLERAVMFWRFHVRNKGACDFQKVLYLMLRSGKFYPAMSWVAGAQGRTLDKERADAIWKVMVNPDLVTYTDVDVVFFERGGSAGGNVQPRADWFLNRWRSSALGAEMEGCMEDRSAHLAEIRNGKLKVIDVPDDSSCSDDLTISLERGYDVPLQRKSSVGIVIR